MKFPAVSSMRYMFPTSLALFLAADSSLTAQTVTIIAGNRGVATESFSSTLSTTGGLTLNLGLQVDYLVVAGGGGGGGSGTNTNAFGSGGGGAGGLLTGSLLLGQTSTQVVVGAGGAGGPRSSTVSEQQGSNGGNSVFGSLTAIGGGGGGAFKLAGNSGGSGGGGGGRVSTVGGAGTTNELGIQGYSGGLARSSDPSGRSAGGGGGGAGSAGGDGDQTGETIAGNGGAGLSNSITGTAVVYAGGGGGGAIDNFSSQTAGTGGSGGGGAGSTSGNATSGTNGLGGGGGGAGTQGTGGDGGSGAVILRYLGSVVTDGGTVSAGTGAAEGYTIRTFSQVETSAFAFNTQALGSTISSDISGSGALTLDSAGTIVFTGNATHTGGTFVNAGTLKLGNGGTSGALGGNVSLGSSAVLEYNRSEDATFASISGAGAGSTLDMMGTGALSILDASNFNGFLNIRDSVVRVGGSLNADRVQLLNHGQLTSFNGDTTIDSNVLALGENLILGDSIHNGLLTLNNRVQFGYDGPTILNLETRSDVIMNEEIKGMQFYGANGLTKSGVGKLTVNQLSYSGATSVQEGTLIVNGTTGAGAFSVASGATLGGSGVITGNTSISGIHSPGNSPGVQTFESDLTYTVGSNVIWELIDNTIAERGTNYDGIDVIGDLIFTGPTTLTLDFALAGSEVNWLNDFWGIDRLGTDGWKIFDVVGTISGYENLTLAGGFLDRNEVELTSARAGALFFLHQADDGIFLNYAVIPEPSAALLGLLGSALLLRRKRQA